MDLHSLALCQGPGALSKVASGPALLVFSGAEGALRDHPDQPFIVVTGRLRPREEKGLIQATGRVIIPASWVSPGSGTHCLAWVFWPPSPHP